jgi:hypothetical protein
MVGTVSNIKFKQYFQATPDENSAASDSGSISVRYHHSYNNHRVFCTAIL